MQKILILAFILGSLSSFARNAPTEKAKRATERTTERTTERMEKAVESTKSTMNQQGVTADTQMMADQSRTEVSRKLRARIMADNQLSTQAHNITIVTNEDAITLKGNVANRAEKVKLENYARSMAGDLKVFNQLEYKR